MTTVRDTAAQITAVRGTALFRRRDVGAAHDREASGRMTDGRENRGRFAAESTSAPKLAIMAPGRFSPPCSADRGFPLAFFCQARFFRGLFLLSAVLPLPSFVKRGKGCEEHRRKGASPEPDRSTAEIGRTRQTFPRVCRHALNIPICFP